MGLKALRANTLRRANIPRYAVVAQLLHFPFQQRKCYQDLSIINVPINAHCVTTSQYMSYAPNPQLVA